ncbi:hypothetical protein ACFE04_017872 [Oxalis oulophora]
MAEERAQRDSRDDIPLSEGHLSISHPILLASSSLPKPLPSSPPIALDTYIVQYPKDQIYRVPPPEHAIIVERHRSPANKKRPRRKRILWILSGLAAVAALLGVIFISIYNSFDPKLPDFSVKSISVNTKSSSKHQGYKITLEATNPNQNMGTEYSSNNDENEATSKLSFKNFEIGKGKSSPEFDGESEDSSNVVLVVSLDGTDKKLPDEIQVDNSKHVSKSSHPMSLRLGMSLKAKFNVGVILRWWSKNLNVECDFKVSGLKKTDIKILSQKCKTN